MRIILTFGFLLIFLISCAQEENKCLMSIEGYIYKFVEKETEGDLMIAIDYFFSKKDIEINKGISPLNFIHNDDVQVIRIDHLHMKNQAKYFSEGYKDFDDVSDNEFELIKHKDYTIKKYRAIIAGYLKEEPISESASVQETTHTYSYLKNLSKEELKMNVKVIYPEIVKVW